MADDLRISTAFPRHPKTVKLRRRLGDSGAWALLCLLAWVADNRPDGDLAGLTAEDLEIAADWTGESGAFVTTIAQLGFLEGSEASYVIHDWAQHNPWAANRPARIEAARAAARKRWQKGGCDSDAIRMQTASEGNAGASEPHQVAMPASPLPASPLPSSPLPTTVKEARMRAAFAQPTLEQVSRYCQERRNTVDPEVWFNHYTSNGWKVGRNSMRDWKAAVRTWEQNGVNHANGSGNRAEQRRDSNMEARKAARAKLGLADRCGDVAS